MHTSPTSQRLKKKRTLQAVERCLRANRPQGAEQNFSVAELPSFETLCTVEASPETYCHREPYFVPLSKNKIPVAGLLTFE